MPQSPFHNNHLQSGAQMIDAAGFSLVWSYGSVEEEVKMVRERAGFIDYSFNSLKAVVGKDALGLLQKLSVNDFGRIGPGKAIYTSMLNESGEFVHDLTALWLEENFFIVCIDWGDLLKNPAWIEKQAEGLEVYTIDTNLAVLAFQGPKSRDLLKELADIEDLPYFGLKRTEVAGIPAIVARMGFTGELGYEIYVKPIFANDLWDVLLKVGENAGVGPYGLSASTVLGLEKGLLWGEDFYGGSSPLEVGLGWTVRFEKSDFIGKEALLKRKKEGLKTKLVGFEVGEPDIFPASGDELLKGIRKVGHVTNANLGLTIGKSIGRGWVDIEYAREGEDLEIKQYTKRVKVKVSLNKDWYDPKNKKVRS
jgi:aminomethyltransferase